MPGSLHPAAEPLCTRFFLQSPQRGRKIGCNPRFFYGPGRHFRLEAASFLLDPAVAGMAVGGCLTSPRPAIRGSHFDRVRRNAPAPAPALRPVHAFMLPGPNRGAPRPKHCSTPAGQQACITVLPWPPSGHETTRRTILAEFRAGVPQSRPPSPARALLVSR